ncbi:MAG TPA: hypothetical protein VL027_11650 [Spongiibacteraceae bacterium]|jgi:predicted ATP-dependent serine protease|nr:hypothetical protein [Spongiibacteraceae bacterium]HUH38587.1 hypothetical protein [Spongiibacteraceae bacterium]
MSYQCRDCSYRARSPFIDGRCPGCGSYDIFSTASRPGPRQAGSSPVRLAILVLLSAYLAWEIGQRLSG